MQIKEKNATGGILQAPAADTGSFTSDSVKNDLKQIVFNTVRVGMPAEKMPDHLRLAGDLLDSMAVVNLVVAIEEYFGFYFEDDDLTADAFETIQDLAELVLKKLQSFHVQ